ncbi:putative uncharacterized protein [Bifidobacterium pseudocatenulatum CAG:263]|nr:putative uncharacterized protein [Bifidobacterium pseudocatenulatum CAG:263]
MPFLITLLVIALIVAFLFLSTLFIVPQQQAYIIERFGKFNKVQFAGIHIRIPFVDRIAMKTNMRVNQLNVQLETKTLDNVFVTVVASTQFRVDPSNVATAYYELRDPAGQLRSYMEDALRSAIPALSLDDAFSRIALPGIGFVCQRLCFKHDFRIGFPTGDRAFDALASHDFRIKTCAGENTGRTVAAQILRHATHLKFLRVRDAVHGSSLHRGQGVQVIHLGLSKTTTHDGSPCVVCG